VSTLHDIPYIESKIAIEQLFTKRQEERDLSLDIVRLGNIWGYASGSWAVPMVQKLVTGRPIGITGAAGHSNTTDVGNVASYLVFLIRQVGGSTSAIQYHHLAEFSRVSWSEWIDPIAATLGVDAVYAAQSALKSPASNLFGEVAEALTPLKPKSLYQRLSEERIAGSWIRSAVRRLPPPARTRLKSDDSVFAADPAYDWGEQAFLTITAGHREFRSVVDSEWTPLLSKKQSLERVLRWLERD
jgi:thioester reductase-like protein